MCTRTCLLIPLLCALLVVPAAGQATDEVIYVKQQHPAASDENPGTQNQPLRTVQEAMDRATANKEAHRSTKVVIGPGIYREAVTFAFTNYPSNQPGNDTPVVVEGAGPGETIISGSDIYENWQVAEISANGENLYSHAWPYDWGVAEDPTSTMGANGRIPHPEIVLRREMVFVNGERMKQVLSRGAIQAGTFYVDEAADKLYLRLPAGVNPVEISTGEALIEVAVRAKGWLTRYEDHLTLRGFTVQHVATPWAYGSGALVVSNSDHVHIENVAVLQNNFVGLTLQLDADMTLTNVTSNHNGHSGWGLWKDTNFLAEDIELSYNNWRGAMGDYTFWGPGNKSMNMHGMTVRGLKAMGNHSRGLWLDTDHTDVLLKGLVLKNNLKSGLFLEANQGPIKIRDAEVRGNQAYAILNASSQNVTIINSVLVDNQLGGLHISGTANGRMITNFETGEIFRVRSRNWTFTGNTIARGSNYLIGTTFGHDAWTRFVSTLTSDGNTWWHPNRRDAFEWYANELITLNEWQQRTNEDQHSVFEPPSALPVELVSFEAVADGHTVRLSWRTAGEAHNAGFEIQHKQDGQFEKVGYVKGHGTTNEVHQYTYRIEELTPDTHIFRLKQVGYDGTFEFSPEVEATVRSGSSFRFSPPHPNPFSRRATFTLRVPQTQHVEVALYDMLGRRVVRLHDGKVEAGRPYTFRINGRALASGTYVYRIAGEHFQKSGTAVLVR